MKKTNYSGSMQPELFDWDDPDVFIPIKKKAVRKKRRPVNYEELYAIFLKQKIVTFAEIEAAAGVSHNAVAQVITTLSLKYPITDIKRGVYMLCTREDYQ